ncbi:GyrI-like domain-containing protein [Halostagnicola sp. A-GB9-2]|uniref:GyrI-like domain-containing protein n=1 Tax=Halostagnicola sp. A-GB9-2 TaxID=3048066 RepID=UPI0024C06E02|nr:GyrI-like domain-containing protein [Halostagnicola sp. A-GB9-2]MDJ1434698.1 GyrI-like domain-containing protein [Halostagnicola sp. A-GB9-2]
MTATTPSLEHRSDRPCVEIPIEATLAEWGQVNALVGELLEWLERHEEPLVGAPFYRYRVLGDETRPFELEVGVPTEGRLDGDDRVQPGTIPAGTYAILVHEGDPDDLPGRHAALEDWAEASGHDIARRTDGETTRWEGRYEHFQTDPTAESDRSKWITEITYLLRDDFPEELTAPTRRALAGAGYSRLDQLDGADPSEIEALHGIGPSVLETLQDSLESEEMGFADGGTRP